MEKNMEIQSKLLYVGISGDCKRVSSHIVVLLKSVALCSSRVSVYN